MMDGSFVKEMERVVGDGRLVEVDGRKYSSLSMKPIIYQPRPAPLSVGGLNALADYLINNPDKLDPKDVILHVESPTKVSMLSVLFGEDRGRDRYMVAEYEGAVFSFGEWMAPEKFIIGMSSLFVPTTGRDEILRFVSRLKVENENELVDDGVTQVAKVRTGIKGGLTESEPAPSRVTLVPFRTFREITQPTSEFILRMKSTDGKVFISLTEADGGAWKIDAMDTISQWLSDAKLGVSVIA